MALAQIYSAALIGLDATLVTVEVDVANRGLASFQIVGLPDTAINESKERVRTAMMNAGFDFPPRRIIVNLAPADLPKSGPIYDLPIALSLLIASGQLDFFPPDTLVIGELALDGHLRPVQGILPIVMMAQDQGIKKVVLPQENADEASLIEAVEVFPINHFAEVIKFSDPNKEIEKYQKSEKWQTRDSSEKTVSLADIKGQFYAKRALEIAAAGSHNLILHGPPGSGKTMLAKALASIMPEMTKEEVLEVTKIYSVSGLLTTKNPLVLNRPFRSPHHTSSAVSLIGGGSQPKPGEISLAHRGILFLDELPEFPRHVLEALRQPLEDRLVTVSRALGTFQFPAHFTLVAAYNPCPCGNLYDPKTICNCTQSQILRYQKKLSAPLLDRIDLHIEVPRVKTEDLMTLPQVEEIELVKMIKQRVQSAKNRQLERFAKTNLKSNSEIMAGEMERFCHLTEDGKDLIKMAIDRLNLSARAYHRILKVARTIADLENSANILESHLTEALQYRPNKV